MKTKRKSLSELQEFEALIEKGMDYIDQVRKDTSKRYKVYNPEFISLLAALTFCDENNLDFHSLIDAMITRSKYHNLDKFRLDFIVYKSFRQLYTPTLDDNTDESIAH